MVARTSYLTQGSIVAGRYRLLNELGRGGMGRVFQAMDTHTGEKRAIKLLKSEHVNRTKIVLRFQREAGLAATLRHQHICPVVDHGVCDNGIPFLVMPLLLGKTLNERLKKGPMDPDEATRYVLQILEALEVAHEKRIAHRDLKPSNIMLAARRPWDEKRVVVLDFGISKILDANNSLTTAGGSLGTPAYMAPEQAASLKYDHRIDIYALGVVLYEMLTGQRPFDGETPKSVKHKIPARTPLLPSRLNPSISKHLQQVIVTALAHNPDDRYDSAAQMKVALTETGGGSPGDIEMPTWEKTAREVPMSDEHSLSHETSTRPNEISISGLDIKRR